MFLPRPAHALLGDSEGSFGLDGSIRNITAGIDNYDNPAIFGAGNEADLFSQSILRLTVLGRPTENFSYEIHGVQDLSFSSIGGGAGFGLFGGSGSATRYRALDAVWEQDGTGQLTAALWLDRAAVKLALPGGIDVTLGRQAVTLGKAYFWNPLDVFLAFDPRQFDRDYKAGVDALRVDAYFGAFSGASLIAAAGREIDSFNEYARTDADRTVPLAEDTRAFAADWYGSALLGRLFTNFEGWDLSLQGGKVYGGYQAGGGATGEIGPLEVRLEALYHFAIGNRLAYTLNPSPPPASIPLGLLVDDHFVGVLGIGHRFENTLQLEFEYLRNGSGDNGNRLLALTRLQTGGTFHVSENVGGFLVSYEILPILVGQAAALLSFDDGSAQFQPGLTWSASENIEVLAGAIVSAGKRPSGGALKSEFGTYPDFYYVEVKAYF